MNQPAALDPELAQLQHPMRLWTDTFKAYKATLRPALCLSLGGIAIPLFILHIYFDQLALRLAPTNSFINSTSSYAENSNFSSLFSNLISFSSQYLSGFTLVAFTILSMYFSIVVFAIHFNRKGQILSMKEAIKIGTIAFLKKGLISFLISLLIFSILARFTQIVVILAAIACSMIPALILSEQLSSWRALKMALGFGYAKIGQKLNLTIVFRVLSFGMFLYSIVGLSTLLAENLLQFDRVIPVSRKLWTYSIGDAQVPVFYLATNLFLVTVTALALHFYAILTSVLLHHISQIKSRIVKWV